MEGKVTIRRGIGTGRKVSEYKVSNLLVAEYRGGAEEGIVEGKQS